MCSMVNMKSAEQYDTKTWNRSLLYFNVPVPSHLKNKLTCAYCTISWAIITSTAASEEITRHPPRIERRVITTCRLPVVRERTDIYMSVVLQASIMKHSAFHRPSSFLKLSLKMRRPVRMRDSKMRYTFTGRRQA